MITAACCATIPVKFGERGGEMAQHRHRQLESEIKRAISSIIANDLKDPRIGFVSVTGVELTRDLSYCKIYVSVLGSDSEKQESLAGLTAARGFLRRELGRRVRMRKLPELIIELDDSIEYGAKINKLLRELKED